MKNTISRTFRVVENSRPERGLPRRTSKAWTQVSTMTTHDGNAGGRKACEHARKIVAQSHGGESYGRSKAYCGGDPSRQKSDYGMKAFRQVVVLSSRPRHARAQLAVCQGSAGRGHAADDPKHHQSKDGVNARRLESEAGEHTGANHVGDHQRCCRIEADGFFHHLNRC